MMRSKPHPRKRLSRVATHEHLFTDHSNQPAKIVHSSSTGLPPLYGYSLYLTHPDVHPSEIDAKALLDGLLQHSSLSILNNPGCPIHLRLYFLPDADIEACMTHYKKEKDIHGDYGAQISAIENAIQSSGVEQTKTKFEENSGCGLPGFVPSYVDTGAVELYHNRLFVLPGAELGTGSVRKVDFVPGVSQEEWDELRDDEAGDEPEILPNHSVWEIDQFYVPGDESRWFEYLGGELYSMTPQQHETEEIWREAEKLGWISWPRASSS